MPRHTRSLPLLLLAAFALLHTTGCAALNVKQPTAALQSANIANVSAQGVRVNFDLGVQNPNGFSIPLSQAKYKLALAGVQVLDDSAKPDAAIPANGSSTVTLPVQLDFAKLVSAEQALARGGGNVPYDFDGRLDFAPKQLAGLGLGGQSVNVPVRFSGTLNFRDALAQLARDPATLARLLTDPSARRVLESVGLGGAGGFHIPGLP